MDTLRRAYLCLWVFPFFTLNSEYRTNLFKQIHQIIFFGNGGYNWQDVYNMPIWLRKFTYNEINDYLEKEREQIEASKGKKQITAQTKLQDIVKSTSKVDVPDFVSKFTGRKK